jgi:membrane-associated phospholipid phosphatase
MSRRSLIAVFALYAPRVGAEPAQPDASAYELRLDVDLPAIAVATAATSAWFIRVGPAWCAPICDGSQLNAFDRPFAGRYSPGWTTAGTIAATAVMASPPLILLAFERPIPAIQDSVVIGEAMLVTSGVEAVLQTAVRRPRPFLYGTAAPLADRVDTNGALSFPSGHTGLAFAATFATWRTLDVLHASPRWRWLAFTLGFAGSSFVAVSRVAAGDHFPTDVIAGTVIGSSIGVLIPALHRRRARLVPTADGVAAVGTF